MRLQRLRSLAARLKRGTKKTGILCTRGLYGFPYYMATRLTCTCDLLILRRQIRIGSSYLSHVSKIHEAECDLDQSSMPHGVYASKGEVAAISYPSCGW